MTSSSGYSTESLSHNSDISGTKKGKTFNLYSLEKDFKLYEKFGAENGMSEGNSGYVDLNDIGLDEKSPYDNNIDKLGPKEPDWTITKCRKRNCVISIISVAVLVGGGIVLCLLLTCNLPGRIGCPPPPPPPPPSPQPSVCTVWRGATCRFEYTSRLRKAKEIRLVKETVVGNALLFNVTDVTNDTHEVRYNQTNKMNLTVYVQDDEIEVIFHIWDTQCSHYGNYNIRVLSDEHGFVESIWRVNVLAQCPCQFDFNIRTTGAITCSFPNAANMYVTIQKALSGDKQNVLVNGSEIIRPIDLHPTNGFSATWSKDGTLNIQLSLGLINCSHEGDYYINVTMNGTSTVYDVYTNVIVFPQKPIIALESPGMIQNKGGRISCVAMTGCSKTKFELELSGSGNDHWESVEESSSASYSYIESDLGYKTQSVRTICIDQVENIEKRKLRCSYKVNGELFTSPVLSLGIIPDTFCEDKINECNYGHPYFCNKYITCVVRPVERLCHQPNHQELHFVISGNCEGSCVWPVQANCTKNYCI